MRKWAKVFSIFFIFGILVYCNSMNNQFSIDDHVLLSNPVMSQTKFISSQMNPYLQQSLGVRDTSKIFVGFYRPFAMMLNAFCYSYFKDNHWQYHLFNLLLFVFSSSLIYLLIRRLTGNDYLAFLAGLFFLIHPINGILVDNIVANALSFQIILIIATILLLLESLEKKGGRPLYFLSLFFSFLSLFWYDLGVMTPVYVSAVIIIFRQDSFKKKAVYLFPFFLISLSFLFLRSYFLNGTPFLKGIAYFHMSAGEYLATLFRLIGWYISKLFYPQGIVMQWAIPVQHEHLFWSCFFINGLHFSLFLVFKRENYPACHRLDFDWRCPCLFSGVSESLCWRFN